MSRQQAKLETRKRLLDQGVAMLTERGYHGTGLQELLDGIGIPKGSFYNYFESKECFGAEAIAHYIEPFILKLDEYLRRTDLSALQALSAYFEELANTLDEKQFQGGCLLGNLMGEIGDTSDTCRVALAQAVHRYRDKLLEGLVLAQGQGDVRQDIDAEQMADLLTDAWQGALLRMKIERSTRPLRMSVQHLLQNYFRV